MNLSGMAPIWMPKQSTNGRMTVAVRYALIVARPAALTFVTDALGRTTQQYYDIHGYAYRIVYPDNREEWFFRDAAKHVTRHVMPDGTAESFTWDSAGHLTSQTTPDGRTAYYVWDRRAT